MKAFFRTSGTHIRKIRLIRDVTAEIFKIKKLQRWKFVYVHHNPYMKYFRKLTTFGHIFERLNLLFSICKTKTFFFAKVLLPLVVSDVELVEI